MLLPAVPTMPNLSPDARAVSGHVRAESAVNHTRALSVPDAFYRLAGTGSPGYVDRVCGNTCSCRHLAAPVDAANIERGPDPQPCFERPWAMSTHNCFASVPEASSKISPVETDASSQLAELRAGSHRSASSAAVAPIATLER